MSKKIVIYTTKSCPFCIQAKLLLNRKQLNYQEISVDNNSVLRADMAERAGRSSVPQIWIDDTHIGGCDDLYLMNSCGELDEILNE